MPADGDSTRESVRYGAARDLLPVLSLPVVDTKRSAAGAGAVDARPASNIMVATASPDRRFMRRVQHGKSLPGQRGRLSGFDGPPTSVDRSCGSDGILAAKLSSNRNEVIGPDAAARRRRCVRPGAAIRRDGQRQA